MILLLVKKEALVWPEPEIISVIRSTHVFYQLQILQLIPTQMSLEELGFVLRDLK